MSTDAYTHISREAPAGRPIVFAFHGTGANEAQLFTLAGELVPEGAVVAPRGDVSEHGAARFFRRAAEGVYDMEDLARATAKMAAFVEAHIVAAQPSRVIGLGYSNGANILASVLFARPDLFNDAILMHPLIPFQPQITGGSLPTRILMTAGRHDPICPPQLTTRLESWLKDAGAPVVLTWHDGAHEVRPSEIEAAARFLAQEGNAP